MPSNVEDNEEVTSNWDMLFKPANKIKANCPDVIVKDWTRDN